VNAALLFFIAAQSLRPFPSMSESMRPYASMSSSMGGDVGAVPLAITALPYTRTVTCTGDITLTGTATGAGAVSWAASPDGASGACTGTTSWSCAVAVSPNAAGEGVETITITQGANTASVDVGFYVDGARACYLAQSVNGTYNNGLADASAVATWVDLGSGAKNVTQATGSAQPSLRLSVTNGQPMVRWDGGDGLAAAAAADWTFLHDGTGATAQVVSSTTSSGFGTLFATSRVTDRGFAVRYETTFKVVTYLHDGAVVTLTAASTNNTIVSGQYHDVTYTNASASTPDVNEYVNNTVVASGTPTAVSALAPSNPFTIGKSPASGTLQFTGDMWRVILYTTELTSTELGINKAVDEWALGGSLPLVAAFDQPQQNRWVFLGDSITHGSQGVVAWPTKFATRVPFKNYTNAAVSGATAADIRAQFDANCVWPASSIPSRIFIMGGVNDVRTGATAAATFSTMSSLYAAAEAQGSEVIALTVTPFGSSTIYGWSPAVQVELEALNASIRTASVAEVVDLYPLMGDTVDPQDLLALYSAADGIHPSEVGSQFISDTVATALGL
jgi:lysophospholipase L1-like esterase